MSATLATAHEPCRAEYEHALDYDAEPEFWIRHEWYWGCISGWLSGIPLVRLRELEGTAMMNRGQFPLPTCRTQVIRTCLQAASLAVSVAASGTAGAEDWDTPLTRLRPIGSPSAVDFYNPPPAAQAPVANAFERAASNSFVRQAAMMQASGGFSMPTDAPPAGMPSGTPSSSMPAPLTQLPALGPIAPSPREQSNAAPLPRPNATAPPPTTSAPPPTTSAPAAGAMTPPAPPPGMAAVPRTTPPAASAPSGDYAPLAQPQLSTTFATMGNCRNITPPSGYRSDRILTCGPPVSYVTTVGASAPPPSYLPPPAQIGPAVSLPPGVVPADALPLAPVQTVIPGSSGHRPLISFGQERYPVQVGQGIFGQPTAYVPGQSFRNAIRYLTW